MKRLICKIVWLTNLLFLFYYPFVYPADSPVKIERKEGGKITLDNDLIRFTFSSENQFKLLEMSEGEFSWIPSGGSSNIVWQFTLKGPEGVNPLVKPFNGIYEGVEIKENTTERGVLAFKWKMRLSKNKYYPVRVLVSLAQGTRLSEWNIEIDLPEGWKVTDVSFPRITVNRSDSSKIIMPAGWGIEYTLEACGNYSAQYPSCTGVMQLMCMQTGKEALYFATHDVDASIKTFQVKSEKANTTLSTEIVTSEAWTPKKGGTFKLPWNTSIGLCANGWEQAVVEWYRPFSFQTVWGSKSFASRNLPKWLLDADMWLRPHFTTKETQYWLKKGIEYFGPEVACHWYRWHQIEYDVDYPEFFPPNKEFVPMMKEMQNLGTHVIPYINGRLWDPFSESYEKMNGNSCSCRKEDGSIYTEIYGSMIANTVTCPSSDTWRQIITQLVDKIQTDLGSDGVYIDQIGAAPGVPCWAKNHPHAQGGGEFWHKSYRELVENVRNKLQPEKILMTEENAECFLDLFDVMLMVNTPQGTGNPVPLFPLVYSDRMMLTCFMYYPQTEKVNSMSFRMKNVLGLLWGAQLGWIKPELIMSPEAETEAAFLREMVRFRKKQHDLIYGGRFIKEIIPEGDNPILYVPTMGKTPAVRGSLWIGADGTKAILMVNMDDHSHKVCLTDNTEIFFDARQCIRIDVI